MLNIVFIGIIIWITTLLNFDLLVLDSLILMLDEFAILFAIQSLISLEFLI